MENEELIKKEFDSWEFGGLSYLAERLPSCIRSAMRAVAIQVEKKAREEGYKEGYEEGHSDGLLEGAESRS